MAQTDVVITWEPMEETGRGLSLLSDMLSQNGRAKTPGISQGILFLLLFFDTRFHLAQAGFKLTMELGITLNLCSSCLLPHRVLDSWAYDTLPVYVELKVGQIRCPLSCLSPVPLAPYKTRTEWRRQKMPHAKQAPVGA